MFLKWIISALALSASTAALVQGTEGQSEPIDTFVPRQLGYCNDLCANLVDGEGKAVKLDFESHCSSFLRTTVATTVVNVVSTSTITGFANIAPQSLVKLDQRQDFTPSSTFYRQWFTPLSTSFYTSTYNPSPTPTPTPTPTAVSNLVQTGTDGKFTVFPSYIPETVPLHWPGCADRKHPIKVNQSLFTKQFSSVCSCRGIMPTTTTMPTATSTVIEVTQMISHFKLKARLHNGTAAYIKSTIDKSRPRKNRFVKDVGFSESAKDGQLFSLTPDGRLESEEGATLGWQNDHTADERINGKLLFLDKAFVAMADNLIFPRFYIQPEGKAGKWVYKLLLEKSHSWFIWMVTLKSRNVTMPDERILMLRDEKQIYEIERHFLATAERLRLFVEPAS